MVLLISYDLNGKERPASYEKVKAYIEGHAVDSIRPLYSQWFVQTNDSPQAWVNGMTGAGVVDANDRLFIVQVRSPYQGWLGKDDWAWLTANGL